MLFLSDSEFIIAMAAFGALVPAGVCWSCWDAARSHFHNGIGTARLPVLFAGLTTLVTIASLAAVLPAAWQAVSAARITSFVVLMAPAALCGLMLGSVIKYEVFRRVAQAWMAAHDPHRSEGPYDFSLHGEAEWRAHPERWCILVANGAPAHRGVIMKRNGVVWMIDDQGLNRALIEEMIKAGVERVDRYPNTGGRVWYGPLELLEDWIEGVMRRGWEHPQRCGGVKRCSQPSGCAGRMGRCQRR